MHAHSRLQHVLSHLEKNERYRFDIEQLDRNLQRIFRGFPVSTTDRVQLVPSACNNSDFEPGEPQDRFVQLSRNLQKEKTKKPNKIQYRPRPTPKEDETPLDKLTDPRVLLGVAATGVALAFLPSSSPVPRSLLSRLWPQIIQFLTAYLVYLRKQQDQKTDTGRSNTVLYVIIAVLQFFTAVRDFKGHTLHSLVRRSLLGPLDPFFSIMNSILLSLPSFLFKTILLSGISVVGRITIFTLMAAAIVGSLGLLIVLAADNL